MRKHAYRDLSHEELEELFSNYLIDSWSFSKISSFARNEKSFEMEYIYGEKPRVSPSTVAGQAYHSALQYYFTGITEGKNYDVVELEQVAFALIEEYEANKWKVQKTNPTIEDCIKSAIQSSTILIKNFMVESDVYLSEIDEVLFVEKKLTQFLTINGVDIPLPCNLVIDLVIKTKSGKNVVIDHKSKRSFSDELEAAFTGGKQAIIYTLAIEEATGIKIDEVWFVENKYSQNKDKSPQLKSIKIEMNKDTRMLYEAMVYEPLKRMLEAVSNPDYLYLINDSDNLVDGAELQEFWAKTMIAEVGDFDIPENKKEIIEKRLKKTRDASIATITPTVIKNFKKFTEQFIPYDLTNKDMTDEQKIEHILRSFGIVSKVQYKFNGFSSATYLIEIQAGTAISSISRYKLDIANALNVPNVRIMKDLFIHEGKAYLSIESAIKRESDLFYDTKYLNGNRIPLGIDNFKNVVSWDLDNHSTPHMLVCGATGSGKSVFLKSTIEYAMKAGVNDVFIFDPKFEFASEYKNVPGVNVYSDIDEIELQMMILVDEMNELTKTKGHKKTLVVFDEFADAVANSRKGGDLKNYSDVIVGNYKSGMPKTKRSCTSTDKSLEENMRILLQKGRSTGFRIIAATQRASVKVITGDAKVNFPVQVCFRVPKEIDSKVVIDESGAESLNGRGDGLIKSPEYMDTIRFQAFYKK